MGHQTLRATFEHMSSVVEFWTALMTGQPVNDQPDDRALAALIDRHERAFATFATLARRVRDEQRLDDTFADPDDDAIRLTFGRAILHVILHNAQHRSETLHMLERLGVPAMPEGNPLEWELLTQQR